MTRKRRRKAERRHPIPQCKQHPQISPRGHPSLDLTEARRRRPSRPQLRPASVHYASWQTRLFEKPSRYPSPRTVPKTKQTTCKTKMMTVAVQCPTVPSCPLASMSTPPDRRCELHELTELAVHPLHVASEIETMGDVEGEEQDLHRLTQHLVDNCRSAPRHGRNGRTIVLAAAASIEDDYEFPEESIPVQRDTDARSGPSLAQKSDEATEKPPMTDLELFEAIPPRERPCVRYQPMHQKLPRYKRQLAVDRLAGAYLCLMLQRLGLTSREEWTKEISRNEELRRLAVESCDKHERDIYRKCYSEGEYLRTMRNERAKELYVDVCWWKTTQLSRNTSMSSSTGEVMLRQCLPQTSPEPIPEHTSNGGLEPGEIVEPSPVDQKITKHVSQDDGDQMKSPLPLKNKDLMREDPDHTEPTTKRQKLNEMDHSLKPEETDESTTDKVSSKPRQPSKDKSHHPPNQEKAIDGSRESCTDATTPAGESRNDGDTVRPTEADVQATAPPKSKTPDHEKKKHESVLAVVRSILNPYFSADMIDRAAYKSIALKVVNKVLSHHSKDKNADFLVDELDEIKGFTRSYVKHYRRASG